MIKSGGLEQTDKSDSRTNRDIAVSTTTRIMFRKLWPEEYGHLRNTKLNDVIATTFMQNSSNVYHYFWIDKENRTIAEIRGGPSGIFFISALRGNRIDILTVQSSWKAPKYRPRKDYIEMEGE